MNSVTFSRAAWSEAFSAIRTAPLRDLHLLPSPAGIPLSRNLRSFCRSPGTNALPLRPLPLRLRCHARTRPPAPERALHGLLADAIHYLKLSFAERLGEGVF